MERRKRSSKGYKTLLQNLQILTNENTSVNFMKMLIYNLFKTLSDEVQYSESRLDCVSPDVNINKANTVIVPDKFRKDIEALEDYTGRKLESGLCIKVDLSELLTVIPRERKRTDAYNTLVQYLKDEFGIDLIINSKKQKGGNYER